MTLSTEKKYVVYFAYGSNLWRNQMDRRCPENKYIGVGLMRNWKWIINSRGYANIIPSDEEGDVVYGLLYEINADDESRLDVYEGVPDCYEKQHHKCQVLGKGGKIDENSLEYVQILVYVDIIRKEPYPTPQHEYIHRMNQAISDAISEGVPESYVEKYLRVTIPAE